MHREEREFSIVVHAVAEFGDDYVGEEDGFAWHEHFDQGVKPRLVAAVFEALRAQPGWKVISAPRGRDPERALEIDVVRDFSKNGGERA
jgi:hypothetical protein